MAESLTSLGAIADRLNNSYCDGMVNGFTRPPHPQFVLNFWIHYLWNGHARTLEVVDKTNKTISIDKALTPLHAIAKGSEGHQAGVLRGQEKARGFGLQLMYTAGFCFPLLVYSFNLGRPEFPTLRAIEAHMLVDRCQFAPQLYLLLCGLGCWFGFEGAQKKRNTDLHGS